MQTINPFQMWQGSFVPNWLMRRPDINATAKLIYGRLCQYAGRDGLAYPSMDTLGNEVGIGRRQVLRVINQLEEMQLIRRQNQTRDNGRKAVNTYEFLKHDWIDESAENRLPLDATHRSHPDATLVSNPDATLVSHKENHKSLRESFVFCPLGEKDLSLDDDTPTNRFIKSFQNKRPTAGHPLARLTAEEIDETRLRIEEFIDWVGEARIDELIDAIFLPNRRKPTSIKQAIMFAGSIVEKEEKAQTKKENQHATDTNKPKLWSQRIQQWGGRESTETRAARNAERIKDLLEGKGKPAQSVA